MRLGIVAEQLRQEVPGGIGTYVRGLIRGLLDLDDADLEVIGITSRAPRPDPLSSLGVELRTSVFPHRLQMALWDRGIDSRRQDLDVLHLTSIAGPLGGGHGPPRSVMVHDLGWRLNPELTTRRGFRWHEAAWSRVRGSSAALITPSVDVAELLIADGVARDRVTVIAEGSDHLPPADHRAMSRLLEGLGVHGPFLLTVSTLEPRKNLTRLLEAHRLLEADGRSLPLLIVGPAGWGEAPPTSQSALLAGRQPDAVLAALYEACAGFVYVPVTEGFGLPPLEAMAHGAPVVVSGTTPSTKTAPDCWRVDPTDVAEIAEALAEMCGDEPARDRARRSGLAFAASHRWQEVAQRHVDLWRSL